MADTISGKLLTTLNPLALAFDTLDVNGLPKLVKDEDWNKVLYNALGSIVSVGGTSAMVTAIAHRIRKHKWEKKNKEILKAKVNSLYPISSPDYATDDEEDQQKLRELGMRKQANDDDEKTFGDYFKQALMGTLPVVAGVTAGVITSEPTHRKLKKQLSRQLDKEIMQLRNELNALQARAIDMGIAKKANIDKVALGDEAAGIAALVLGTVLAVGSPVVSVATYRYLDKIDKSNNKMKITEDLASENLTNLPQRLSLHLTPEGRPAILKEDKKYLEHLEREVQDADKPESSNAKTQDKLLSNKPEEQEDFKEKVKKLEKEELFS